MSHVSLISLNLEREKPHLIYIQKLDAMTNEDQCTKIGVSKFQFLGHPNAFQLNGRTTFFVLRLFSGREVLDPTLLRCVLGFPFVIHVIPSTLCTAASSVM